jgi:DNA modification methylase
MPKIELIQGDCLEVMKSIPDGTIDMVLTDPPYGTTACKWDSVIPFDKMWERLNKLIKPNGAIVLFGSEPFSSALRMSNIKNYKYDWVWDKTRGFSPQLANIQPMKSHELIHIFGKNGKKVVYYPQKTKLEKTDSRKATNKKHNRKDGTGQSILCSSFSSDKVYTDRFPLSIITFSKNPSTEKLHPTQKPVALMEYLIKTYTNEGEVVLDFTMGSGTTGVACKNLNRNFIGIELDPGYFKIAEARINAVENKPFSLFDA